MDKPMIIGELAKINYRIELSEAEIKKDNPDREVIKANIEEINRSNFMILNDLFGTPTGIPLVFR
jgi:hypothetical protein